MAYLAQADLKGHVPDEWIAGALDDDEDGSQDTTGWDAVAAAVGEDIDGRLATRYAVPLSPVPDLVKAAAKVLAAALLWRRWGRADAKNPWADQEKAWQNKLDRIGRGEEPLYAGSADSGVAITEPAQTHSASGSLMV